MSLYTLPILYLNLGGEMLYILLHRLGAEKIKEQRQSKAMQDIVRRMLNDNVLSTLFTAQPLTTPKRLRVNFFRLANESFLSLTESSMEKLFDLMMMTIKYQFLLCKSGNELLLLTLIHLDSMREMVDGREDAVKKVNKTCTKLTECFHSFSEAQLMITRHTLLAFLHNYDRKISLFISTGRQLADGQLVLPHGGKVPYGVQPPGMIRYLTVGHKTEMVTLWCDYGAMEKKGCLDVTGDRTITIGENLYTSNDSGHKRSKPSSNRSSHRKSSQKDERKRPPSLPTSAQDVTDNPSIAELDFIHHLLIGDPTSTSTSTSDFKLSLFDTELEAKLTSSKESLTSSSTVSSSSTVNVSTNNSRDHLRNILQHFDDVTPTDQQGTSGKGDDLLDLMDNL